jgi:hypothetical protein
MDRRQLSLRNGGNIAIRDDCGPKLQGETIEALRRDIDQADRRSPPWTDGDNLVRSGRRNLQHEGSVAQALRDSQRLGSDALAQADRCTVHDLSSGTVDDFSGNVNERLAKGCPREEQQPETHEAGDACLRSRMAMTFHEWFSMELMTGCCQVE